MSIDVDHGEGGEILAFLQVLEDFELSAEVGHGFIARDGLADKGCKGRCLVIVGLGDADEMAIEEIDADGCSWVLADELFGFLGLLGWRHRGRTQTEGGHELVVVGALDLGLEQMAGVALDLQLSAWLGKDGELGLVGEDHDEGEGILEGNAVEELALVDTDGVELAAAVGTIEVELALVEALELTSDEKTGLVAATGNDKT